MLGRLGEEQETEWGESEDLYVIWGRTPSLSLPCEFLVSFFFDREVKLFSAYFRTATSPTLVHHLL